MTTALRMKSLVAVAAAGLLTLTACSSGGGSSTGDNGGSSSAGETVTINSATMVLPSTPNGPVVEWFFSEVEKRSDGRIVVDRTEPETICPAPEIAQCVRDGRADVGISISDYAAADFPSMSIATIPFLASNGQALMQAIYTANTEHEGAAKQWDDTGIELIAAWSPGKAIMGSNEPIESIDDIDGVRFRVVGALLQKAYDLVGANVVTMPAAETYENVERGVADAVQWSLDGPVDYKMMEQLKYWTDANTGHYTTFAIWMNKDFYDGLPDDLRAIIDEVRDELNGGKGQEQFATVNEAQCQTLYDFPNVESFTAWEADKTEEWKNLVFDQLVDEWIADAEAAGLEDARGYFELYQAELAAVEAEVGDVGDPVADCIARFEDR